MDIKKLQDELNNRPIPEFLGLSPYQMQLILYHPFESIRSIVKFNESFNRDLLIDVPVVTKASLLIKRVGEVGELKATQKGFLPIKLVHELDDFERRPGFRHKATSEENVLSVYGLRSIITDLGWLKKRNSKFSLTKKGQQIYERGFGVLEYLELLKFWMVEFNWSFLDRWFDFHFIQQSLVFTLYMLKQKAKDFFSIDEFVELYIKAFPSVLSELPPEACYQGPEKELEWLIGRRCIRNFLVYFGLVEYSEDVNSVNQKYKISSKFKTTRLFEEVYNWFPPEENNIVVPDGEKVH